MFLGLPRFEKNLFAFPFLNQHGVSLVVRNFARYVLIGILQRSITIFLLLKVTYKVTFRNVSLRAAHICTVFQNWNEFCS